jgi:hypothetical protein
MKRQPTGNDQSWWAINAATWDMLDAGFVSTAGNPRQLAYLKTAILGGCSEIPSWEPYSHVATQVVDRTCGSYNAEDSCELTVLDVKLKPIDHRSHPRYVRSSESMTLWEAGQLLGGN